MNNKTANKFFAGFLVLGVSLIALGILVSAFSLTSTPNSLGDFFKVGDSKNVSVFSSDEPDALFNFEYSPELRIQSGNSEAVFNIISTPEELNSAVFNITLSSLSNFPIGIYSSNFVVDAVELDENGAEIEDSTATIQVPLNYVSSFCRNGPTNESGIQLEVEVKNRGEGESNEWRPLDKIELEVRVVNNLDVELRDVILKLGLFEQGTTRNVIDDMRWISLDEDEYDLGDIDEGDRSSRYTFEFKINPTEIKLDKDYYLVVKAYEDGKENQRCIDYSTGLTESNLGTSKYFGNIRIRPESSRNKMVVVDDSLASENFLTAQCGEEVTLFADVYNIGTRDFENRIKVNLFNRELGLNLEDVILEDLNSGESTKATFRFVVPENIDEKVYPLYMKTYYDYKNDEYRESSSDTFTAYLDVQNCALSPDFLLSAVLESEARAGEELLLKVSLTNSADVSKIFVIGVSGYEPWAGTSKNLETIFVSSGNTLDSIFKFNVNKDAFGEKIFAVNIYSSEGELIKTQPVVVNISELVEPNKGFLGITGLSLSNGSGYLWGLGILNIIIIVLIVIVVLKIARKQ